MSIDPELLKQLIVSFSSEFTEHAQAITNGLLSLEKQNLSFDENHKITEIIFRSAHNIKGTARSLGITDVSEIAHRIESIFSSIQKNNKKISSEIIDLCFDAVDKMQMALQAFIDKKPLSFDLNKVIKNLELEKREESITQTKPIEKRDNLNHLTSDRESIRVPITKIDKVSSLLEEIQINKIAIDGHYGDLTQLAKQADDFSKLWKQIANLIKNPQLLQSANDYLININKSLQSMRKNMHTRINQMSLLSETLQEEVRALRMVPIGNLLSTFPRYVRDLSHELKKEVGLTIKGDDIKIDKVVLEGLKDPLVHLLRNAIDHGIEDTQTRTLKGKPETGLISIDITEEDGRMLISIMDDGAGIDLNKVLSLAENKNLMPKNELEKLNENEILDFIFHPGFSLKDIITDVSGRGVGLDVVKSNIDELNGSVSVNTIIDKYTTFTLSVPLTISSSRGLLIRCSNQHFVIPTISIESVLIVDLKEIVNVQGGQAIISNNATIPLRLLRDILNLEKTSSITQNRIPIVIIKKGHNAIALVIDEIVGEKEIVIKPLQPPLNKVPCAAGGTLLGSNQVVIVLETGDLIKSALKQNRLNPIISENDQKKLPEKPHILVVDDSITTRTLEKSVLESKNYQVTIAVNGKEAWDILQKQKFSLLITDVVMPIMDGFTLTDNVKKSEKLNKLPVIIVTSLGSDEEKKRGIEVGADAYIVKNEFESGALLEVVSQLI